MPKPPATRIKGKHRPLNDDKYKPYLGIITQPLVNTELVDKILPNDKVKDEYIPSLLKQMGITYQQSELSLGCRDVNELRKVHRGNGTFYDKQLVNATPITPLSKQGFSKERLGMGADLKQEPHFTLTWQ